MRYLIILLPLLCNYGKSQYQFALEKPTSSGIDTSFKKDISPIVGKSQVKYHPPPDIPRPDPSYRRINKKRRVLKDRLNASEVFHSAKVSFTIRNLGQNYMAFANNVEKSTNISDTRIQATGNFIEQQTAANSNREYKTEVGTFMQSSVTESISTGNMEIGKGEIIDIPAELPHIPQESAASYGNNELQQQHASPSSTFFLASTISALTQTLDSSDFMKTKEPKSDGHEFTVLNNTHEEESYFTSSNATISITTTNSPSLENFKVTQNTPAPQETVPLSDVISEQLVPIFVKKNTSSFAIDTLSSENTEKQRTGSFPTTNQILESYYGSNMSLETTSTSISEFEPNLSTSTVPSLKLPTGKIEPQESATQYSGDNHEANTLENRKNFSDAMDLNNSSQIGKNLIRTIDASSFDKMHAKPRIHSLLPFHSSTKNVSDKASSSTQISSKQETISRNITVFGSDIVESNTSNDNSKLVITTHEEMISVPTTMTSARPGSYQSLPIEEIPNVTNEMETLGDFEQEASNLQDGFNLQQQSLLNGESFSNLDTEDSTGNIVDIDEPKSQTKVLPSYENKEVVAIQSIHADNFKQEQVNEEMVRSDPLSSNIDWHSTSTQTMIVTSSPPLSLSTTNGFNDVDSDELLKSIENSTNLASSNEDPKEVTSLMFSQLGKGESSAVVVTPSSILMEIRRTAIPIKETTHDDHALSMNWYTTSLMKFEESNQHVILPISEPKMHGEIPHIHTDAITTEEPSETINLSATTFSPLSIPAVIQYERTLTGQSIVNEGFKVNPSLHVNEKISELVETISSYPEEMNENEKKVATTDDVDHWDSQFNTEISRPYNGLPETTSEQETQKNPPPYPPETLFQQSIFLIRQYKTEMRAFRLDTALLFHQLIKLAVIWTAIMRQSLRPVEVKEPEPQYGSQSLPQQLPNSVRFSHKAQPFSSRPYQAYVPSNSIYTGLPKETIQITQLRSASAPIFGLESDRKCCGDSGQANGLATSCSPQCLLLPSCFQTFPLCSPLCS
uniref:Uncharacterized protein n=1 Tax=Onchocerca volvulus TaxID=6282 RepID=A0A8R1XTR2_ONCVO